MKPAAALLKKTDSSGGSDIEALSLGFNRNIKALVSNFKRSIREPRTLGPHHPDSGPLFPALLGIDVVPAPGVRSKEPAFEKRLRFRGFNAFQNHRAEVSAHGTPHHLRGPERSRFAARRDHPDTGRDGGPDERAGVSGILNSVEIQHIAPPDSVIRLRFCREINLNHDAGPMLDGRNLLKELVIEEKHFRLYALNSALIGNCLREIVRLGITPSGPQDDSAYRHPGIPGCHGEVQTLSEREAFLADRAWRRAYLFQVLNRSLDADVMSIANISFLSLLLFLSIASRLQPVIVRTGSKLFR